MADEEKNDSDANSNPRRGNRNATPRGDSDKNTAPKKEPPKPAIDVTLDRVIVDGATQKALITVRCSKGQDAVIGVVQFYCNGTATGEPRPTSSGGIANIWIEGLPLAETAITVRAQVLNSSLMGLSALSIPAAPKKEVKDPDKIGVVEFLEVERQPSTGRNIIPVLVYDEDGKAMQLVEVWLIDAACDREPIPRPKEKDRIYRTDNEGRVAITYTLPASERSRDVTVVVPRKPGAFKRYVLRGPDPVKLRPLPLPKRRSGECDNDFFQRCRDAGNGVAS